MAGEAPYGYMLDPATGQLRPKKRAGRPRTYAVADELDPEAHRAGLREQNSRNCAAFKERNPSYSRDYQAAWREANPDKYSEYNRRSLRKLKAEVIGHYGGHCACCGETELVFLTIDHINDDGAEHRRQLGAQTTGQGRWGMAGAPTYRWLRDNGYPEGFQVLCANCNCAKQWNGGICPHQAAIVKLLAVPA